MQTSSSLLFGQSQLQATNTIQLAKNSTINILNKQISDGVGTLTQTTSMQPKTKYKLRDPLT